LDLSVVVAGRSWLSVATCVEPGSSSIFTSSQSSIVSGDCWTLHTAATTVTGYKALLHWFSSIALVTRIGVEDTGSYGVAVTVLLRSQGFEVVEVNQPNRQIPRLRGKTDSIHWEATARSVLSVTASAFAKSHGRTIETSWPLRSSLSGLR
jgi:hypothetical protein